LNGHRRINPPIASKKPEILATILAAIRATIRATMSPLLFLTKEGVTIPFNIHYTPRRCKKFVAARH
jgi:hypothetical protein